ncbi:MAG: glycosyltransferase family 2 protein [Deltaproteobacteria bacterium]
MTDLISKHNRSKSGPYAFSLLIPSWNNIGYLSLCIRSIKDNSKLDIQIIVIVNEGIDGTIEWLENQVDIDYVHAKENIGICYGLNIARSLIKSEYLVYLNDDMYMLPGWDLNLLEEIKKLNTKKFMISCTMIEPYDTGNSCVIVKNYGDDLQSFNEELLLKEYRKFYKNDWSGSTWPPNVVHIDMWDLVGGLSIEFSPGMYSDPDFSRKLYAAGVRIFKGTGKSLAYHFGSKSTKRIKKNLGRITFLNKWGITSKTFTKDYLKLGKPFSGPLTNLASDPGKKIINRIKRIIIGF